jgi:hypothetical protein
LKPRSLPLAVLIYQSFSSQPLIRGFGPSGCVFSFEHPRGLRFAPTPGYLLSSPSGKKPQNPLTSGIF